MASLSNSTDVYADKLYLSLGEVGVVDLAETVGAEAEKSETYSISVMDMILNDKVDDVEFSALGSIVSLKADKSTTYTKSEVDTNFANLVNSAPAALNQLNELASALANDANYATTVQNQLALKAPLANPTFTGTATVNNLKVNASLYTDDPLGLMLGGAGVNLLGGLTVGGTALITGNLTAPNVYTKSETNDKLAERQLKITTPTGANLVNLFGSDRMLPIKAGMGMAIYQTFGNSFVTIDGPYNCENSYYPQVYPNLIQVLNETRKELKALKAGTHFFDKRRRSDCDH